MAVFLQDDFTGAAADTQLQAWTPDIGGAWSAPAFSVTMGFVGASISVQANGTGARSGTSSGAGGISYNNTPAPSPDYSAQFEWTRYLSGGTAGVVLRLDPTALNCYYVEIKQSNFQVHKVVGGVRTSFPTVANGSVIPSNTAIASVEVIIFGPKITVYVGGAEYGSWTDESGAPIEAAGYAGVGSRYGLIRNLSVATLDGVIVSGDIAGAAVAEAVFVGEKTVASTLSATGFTPVCYMQSQTYRVGQMGNAGGTTAAATMNALPLITAQIYSLSQAPEPDFHSVAFEELATTFASAGSTGGGLVGRAVAGAVISAEGVASDVMLSRTFGQGEGEFTSGSGGTSISIFTGQRIVGARMVSAPSFNTSSFRLFASAFVASEMSSAGLSIADMSGIVPIRMDAAGTSQGSFGPFDVTVPAEMTAVGASIGAFRELEFATGRVRGLGDVVARFDGIAIRAGVMQASGVATLSTWFAAVVLTSQMEASGGVSGRMVSLSFSSNIPTPDDRVMFLPAEDRTISLETEDRTVFLEQEDREVTLAAENRIAFV